MNHTVYKGGSFCCLERLVSLCSCWTT